MKNASKKTARSEMNGDIISAKRSQQITTGESGQKCLAQFHLNNRASLWAKLFAGLLISMEGWHSVRCCLTWKLKETTFKRLYFKLQVSALHTKENASGLLPTVVVADGTRGGETVVSRSKTRPSGETYSANLADLAKSGLLPTPTTGSNRNSKNAIQRIGAAHQNHGVSLGLAQVLEIATGALPKEFNSWDQVSPFYQRLLPTPLARDYIGGRHPDNLKLSGRKPSNSLGDTINAITGKSSQLNPMFISEMMGFPVHWMLIPFLKLSISR